ncbi:MAG: transposase [Opitutaceae bacterium]|jgi:REP element-mobilizing transposase RayT
MQKSFEIIVTRYTKAFMIALEEGVHMYGWKLHAYAIMRNHFHLLIETPQPNLVEGMHWLQSSFATRFNRYRTERGHLFQGRYHAGLIEDYRILGHVVDYVHLNPVRAGILPVDQVDRFRWSSLGAFVRGPRLKGLTATDWLPQVGCEDTATGWSNYLCHLQELAGNMEEQKRLGWEGFSHSWALGSETWRRELAVDYAQHALNPGLEGNAIRALRETRWEQALAEVLAERGIKQEQLHHARKGEVWKIELAMHLRKQIGASCVWLAKTLNLGTPNAARGLLCRAQASRNQRSAA